MADVLAGQHITIARHLDEAAACFGRTLSCGNVWLDLTKCSLSTNCATLVCSLNAVVSARQCHVSRV